MYRIIWGKVEPTQYEGKLQREVTSGDINCSILGQVPDLCMSTDSSVGRGIGIKVAFWQHLSALFLLVAVGPSQGSLKFMLMWPHGQQLGRKGLVYQPELLKHIQQNPISVYLPKWHVFSHVTAWPLGQPRDGNIWGQEEEKKPEGRWLWEMDAVLDKKGPGC